MKYYYLFKLKIRNVLIYLKSTLVKHADSILLIPPTDLNGSFGDEIMVASVVNYHKDRQITLYSERLIHRQDLYANFIKMDYLPWNVRPKYFNYNEVLLLGADNMSGTYGNGEVLQKTNILKQAHKHQVISKILGFSLSANSTEVVKNEFREISSFTKFNLREPDSYYRAKEFLQLDAINLVADVGFLCPLVDCNDISYRNWTKTQHNDGRTLLAICANSIHMRKFKDDQYINSYVSALESLHHQGHYAFVLLYHDIRDLNNGWNDQNIASAIYDRLKDKLKLYFPGNIKNGVELKSYLPYIDATITSRMHLGISGLSLGKPMLGITYENKFSGLQKLFEVDPNRSLVEYTELDKLEEVFKIFISDLPINNIKVANNLDKVKRLSLKNFQ